MIPRVIGPFQTTDAEAAALKLAAEWSKVFIRYKPVTARMVRFRPKLITQLKPYRAYGASIASQMKAWDEHGGTIIYTAGHRIRERLPEHDAQLIVECPVSPLIFQAMVKTTRGPCVIFKPPTWAAHREYVAERYPSAKAAQTWFSAIRKMPEDHRLSNTLGLPFGPVAKVDESPFIRRATLFGWQYNLILRVTPRTPPASSIKYLRNTWNAILSAPELDGVKLLAERTMAREAGRLWVHRVQWLITTGCCGDKGPIVLYNLHGAEPNWPEIEIRHKVRKANLEDMIKRMEAAPDYLAVQSQR